MPKRFTVELAVQGIEAVCKEKRFGEAIDTFLTAGRAHPLGNVATAGVLVAMICELRRHAVDVQGGGTAAQWDGFIEELSQRVHLFEANLGEKRTVVTNAHGGDA